MALPTLTINVNELLKNDTGRDLTVIAVGTPLYGGSVSFVGSEIVYSVGTNSLGVDHFSYTVRDFHGREARALVKIFIKKTFDVVARDNTLTMNVPCGTAVTLTHEELLGNDTGDGLLRVTDVFDPINGTVTMDDTTVTFTADSCGKIVILKTYVAPRRYITGTIDQNGVLQTPGLFADSNNISPLDEGDFAVLTMLRMGSSLLEPGWTPLAQSAQASLFYRRLDKAYIDLHKSPTYTGTTAVPYPYVAARANDVLPLAQIGIETFAVPAGVAPTIDDLFLLTFANTQEGQGTQWRWEPKGFNEDYYRRVTINAFGPTGVNGGGSSSPTNYFSTTTQSVQDSLNRRKAIYEGNQLILSVSGDTYGFRHADFGQFNDDSFSEGGLIENVSNVYAVAYAIRSQPQANVAVAGGFSYTASDEQGSSDSAKVIAPVLAAIDTTYNRFRQAEISINGDGIVGVPLEIQPNNFRIGVHCKSYENQYVTNSSLDRPLDPEPGWTLLNKTPPNDAVAGTIAYQRYVPRTPPSNVDAREVRAFRYMGGLPPISSMSGIEIVADPGETWEDIFVSSQAVAANIPAAQSPYICPRLFIPEGCMSITVMTARSYTALVDVSGGDSVVRMYNRYDFLGMTTWIVQSTTVAPQIVVRRHPDSTRATLDVGTFTIVVKNRKR